MALLNPYKSEKLNLKNRVVMAPMTRGRANNGESEATDLIAEYYEQRASAGLIISEGTHISPNATGSVNIPGIYTQKQIEGWKKVTAAVHQKGGKIVAQLWHVGRISHPDLLGGKLPFAPSAINPNGRVFTPNGYIQTVVPKAMTLEEIEQTVSDFGQAAVNALKQVLTVWSYTQPTVICFISSLQNVPINGQTNTVAQLKTEVAFCLMFWKRQNKKFRCQK